MENLKYPVGRFSAPKEITAEMLEEWTGVIDRFPALLKAETYKLSEAQMDTPYRPEGWTVRQVVHHCADSHMNSFIRFKLALTEEQPIIKPYAEDRWAQQADYLDVSPKESLKIIDGVHARWTVLLKSLNASQLDRTFMHPEHRKIFALEEVIGLYAWHCNHHLAHIEQAINYNNRF